MFFSQILLAIFSIQSEYVIANGSAKAPKIKEETTMRIPSKAIIEHLRKQYPADTKVVLIRMEDPQAPPEGTIHRNQRHNLHNSARHTL